VCVGICSGKTCNQQTKSKGQGSSKGCSTGMYAHICYCQNWNRPFFVGCVNLGAYLSACVGYVWVQELTFQQKTTFIQQVSSVDFLPATGYFMLFINLVTWQLSLLLPVLLLVLLMLPGTLSSSCYWLAGAATQVLDEQKRHLKIDKDDADRMVFDLQVYKHTSHTHIKWFLDQRCDFEWQV